MPKPMIAAPTSWASASWGLIAQPTSPTVTSLWTLDLAGLLVDREVDAHAADLPERRHLRGRAGAPEVAAPDALARRAARTRPGRSRPSRGTLADAARPSCSSTTAGPSAPSGLLRPREELRAGVLRRRLDGEAHQRRRARGARGAVVGDRRRVALHQVDPRPAPRPSRPRRSARGPWTSPGRSPWSPQVTVTDPSAWTRRTDVVIGLRARVRGGDADRLAAARARRARPSRARRRPAACRRARSASMPRTFGHGRSPGLSDVAPPDLERVEAQPLRRLVHLRFARERHLGRPEAAERARPAPCSCRPTAQVTSSAGIRYGPPIRLAALRATSGEFSA